MTKPTATILQALEVGSSAIVPSTKPTTELIEMAASAKRFGGHLTIRACKKPVEDMLMIGRAGGSHVTFDFTD